MAISLEDRAAITDVLNLYAHYADTKQFKLMSELFTEDTVCDYGMIINGRQGLLDFLTGFEGILATSHNICNILIDGDGDKARSNCHVMAWHMFDRSTDPSNPNGPREELLMYGGYEDELVRTSTGWKLSKRTALEYRPGQQAIAADGSVSKTSGVRHPTWP